MQSNYDGNKILVLNLMKGDEEGASSKVNAIKDGIKLFEVK